MNAFRRAPSASMRPRQARVTSTGEVAPVLIRSPSARMLS